MEYRKLPHGEEQFSVIGLGNSSLTSQVGEKEIQATVEMALESGVNYFDMAAGDAAPFAAYGKALAGCREKAYLQVHFGADYHTGKYGWTQDLEEIKRSISWQLEALQTDYIDFGFIHCVDELADLEKAVSGGALDYIQSLKKQGVVRHVGLSSHTPAVVQKALDLGILDMVMFSINPGYDYQQGEYAIGQVDERQALYRRCQAEGVGISVMKAFSGGQLLKAETSPFRQALTEYQCIQYALDKPGVLTVLPGVRDRQDLQRILGFCSVSAQERDYSIWAPSPPRTPTACACTATTASPVPWGWTLALSTSITTSPRQGTFWRGTTTTIWKRPPATVSPAGTAIPAVPSTWPKASGWRKSGSILESKQRFLTGAVASGCPFSMSFYRGRGYGNPLPRAILAAHKRRCNIFSLRD